MEEIERIVEKTVLICKEGQSTMRLGLEDIMKAEAKINISSSLQGATKRSISVNSSKVGRFKYKVAPGTSYAAYVELGTRKMSAQPFIKPAFDNQKEEFKKDLERLVK